MLKQKNHTCYGSLEDAHISVKVSDTQIKDLSTMGRARNVGSNALKDTQKANGLAKKIVFGQFDDVEPIATGWNTDNSSLEEPIVKNGAQTIIDISPDIKTEQGKVNEDTKGFNEQIVFGRFNDDDGKMTAHTPTAQQQFGHNLHDSQRITFGTFPSVEVPLGHNDSRKIIEQWNETETGDNDIMSVKGASEPNDPASFKPCKRVARRTTQIKPLTILCTEILSGKQGLAQCGVNNNNEADLKVDNTFKQRVKSSRRQPQIRYQTHVQGQQSDEILANIIKAAHDNKLKIELIDRRKHTFIPHKVQDHYFYKIETEHEKGRFLRKDVKCTQTAMKIMKHLLDLTPNIDIDGEWIRKGSSGLIIRPKQLTNCATMRARSDIMVIRGRRNGALVDSLLTLKYDDLKTIDHYSDSEIALKLFSGFNKTFTTIRDQPQHVCERDIELELCGEMCGTITQMLAPMFKITCSQCAAISASRSKEQQYMDMSRHKVLEQYERLIATGKFPHIARVIANLNPINEVSEKSLGLYTRIDSLSMNGQTSQSVQINEIAKVIMKGSLVSNDETESALTHLLELTNWYRKRLEAQMSGGLESFRNKISSKTHINLALMCDNQLDVNGMFQWGERGYHAKRLFANYFTKVTDGSQYESLAIRKHIRGSRELAIKNLIVSKDITKMQQSFVGNPIKMYPLGKACVSKLNNNYVYPCCCVTMDDGKPLCSELRFPTKNHLIIGNSGDDKNVRLPPSSDGYMYIVKDGFCYVLIFLAMLINVSEGDAKGFTKKVRDDIIPQLKQWPTMRDLAVMCRYLCAFYPSVITAEIPKILIDHEHKTFHVMDSFGSKTTGYHILKANTVQQLCRFGDVDLESEMNMYNVGGKQAPIHVTCTYGDQKFEIQSSIELSEDFEGCDSYNCELWDFKHDITRGTQVSEAGCCSETIISDHSECWYNVNDENMGGSLNSEEISSDEIDSEDEESDDSSVRDSIRARSRPASLHTIETDSDEVHSSECESDDSSVQQSEDSASPSEKVVRDLNTRLERAKINIDRTPESKDITFFKSLVKAIFSKRHFDRILRDDPYVLLFSMLTPTVIMRMLHDDLYVKASQLLIMHDDDLARIASTLQIMAERVSRHKVFVVQMRIISEAARDILGFTEGFHNTDSSQTARHLLEMLNEQDLADFDLLAQGYVASTQKLYEMKKKCFDTIYHDYLRGLSLCQKLGCEWRSLKYNYRARKSYQSEERPTCTTIVKDCLVQCSSATQSYVRQRVVKCYLGATNVIRSMARRGCYVAIRAISSLYKDILVYINIFVVLSILLTMWNTVVGIRTNYKRLQLEELKIQWSKQSSQVEKLYTQYMKEHKDKPTKEEFQEYISDHSDSLLEFFISNYVGVEYQAKSHSEATLEKIVAYVALFAMLFNSEKSDGVFKVLSKLKTIFSTTDVHYQALDSPDDVEEFLNTTVDFEVTVPNEPDINSFDMTFEEYWKKQLAANRFCANYKTNGVLYEFTRKTAEDVASKIQQETHTEFLVSGAVGSGKSTGLPFYLSQKGKVLIVEPTRPLTENLFNSLSAEPFNQSVSMCMRGNTIYGSGNITIMTTGYALHYLANNREQIKSYDYILVDECHVMDANAIAFYALLKDANFKGKIIKASATIPGHENRFEFKTQFETSINFEGQMTFERFVKEQGSCSNACVVSKGNNILVYVASYSEVDTLSKLLLEKGYKVTKVDGRTMKVGGTQIETTGTAEKKHFIVATNIIENGVTLDIEVVVDFGRKVVAVLDDESRMMRYTKQEISHGERIQRLGRVGRNKPGHILRIGSTQKGIVETPICVATEAAYLCFVYGLPIMPNNVSVSSISKCTTRQARTMAAFELSPFYMKDLVRFDGSMHPEIHKILKKYILRDTEIKITEMACPTGVTRTWNSVGDYNKMGGHILCDENIRLPFFVNGIPEKVHEEIWDVVKRHQSKFKLAPLRTASVNRIAYTLSTDKDSLVRTIGMIEEMIKEERYKHAQFQAIKNTPVGVGNFNLNYFSNLLKTRYMIDHSEQNIEILQRTRSQLLEVNALYNGEMSTSVLRSYPLVSAVEYQTKEQLSKGLCLQGKYEMSKISKDVIVCGLTLAGGLFMIYKSFCEGVESKVHYQAKSRRRLRFRDAADRKQRYALEGDDSTIEQYFGSAYTKKGKQKGTVRGMGVKNHRFYNMYGFDPTEYSIVRFVDPLTGNTYDDAATATTYNGVSSLLQMRQEMVNDDAIDKQQLYLSNSRILEAYYIKAGADKALNADLESDKVLKVTLTPHDPLMVCHNFETIAGYPEKEGEFRRTGPVQIVSKREVPKAQSYEPVYEVEYEAKSLCSGPRNYTAIAGVICRLKLDSDGYTREIYGIGHGPYIITNQHLFTRNNGTLRIKSQHGNFLVKNTAQLQLYPIDRMDIVIIKLPKDHPPFSQKANFRTPKDHEKVCMISVEFLPSSNTPSVSEPSFTFPERNSHFWKHWISTKEGHCGLPFVSLQDGNIVGIHSLSDNGNAVNYFTSFPENFKEEYLDRVGDADWVKGWIHNTENIAWGSLNLTKGAPESCFKATKLVSDIINGVAFQAQDYTWLTKRLDGNLKCVGVCPGNLITKHVVKGKCPMFQLYLNTDERAKAFFEPLLGFYGKSCLNKEAYIKDFTKYASDIVVGEVDTDVFEEAINNVENTLLKGGMTKCNFVTDPDDIMNSLNMKAAVGALYGGKKETYFKDMSSEDIEHLIFMSCKRLYLGKMGIWNGSLKAEIRPIEKVQANKTRSFTAAPIETLLGGKVCVDDFNNNFYRRNLAIPSTVGITKFYKGWNDLMCLLPDGWIYCDADGSRFDSSLTPYLINAVLNIRLRFMEEWDVGQEMLKNLYTEIIYTPIATPDGSIIKKFKGNNSGQPSTVVDNTLMVMLSVQYTLLKNNVKFMEQESIIRYFCNGDDLLIAIHPDYSHILDSFTKHFSDLGLEYDFSNRTMNREELYFMSHRGLLRNGIYIPKLDKERIVSILEWDRAKEPEHRLEAICAAMVEAWGYDELLHEIRLFYKWVLEQAPYNLIAQTGKAPYIAETALKRLYMDEQATESELEKYSQLYQMLDERIPTPSYVSYQATESEDAANVNTDKQVGKNKDKDRDVDVGTSGEFSVPKVKMLSDKMRLPRIGKKVVLNGKHLLSYKPDQIDLYNTRATHAQFKTWYEAVKLEYELTDEQMKIVMNGLMVWCIENGTSQNLTGVWTMMDGDNQMEYPLSPIIDNAKPTFRQIMAHFSDAAEAYIEYRNATEKYMPRYGLQRNLREYSLARYAFDFYEMNSKTPIRAKEAHMQMKAAAVRGAANRMFGLDGNIGTDDENTERHTAADVNKDHHTLLGLRM
nr:polyprotein [Shallot yellow stripe virus]